MEESIRTFIMINRGKNILKAFVNQSTLNVSPIFKSAGGAHDAEHARCSHALEYAQDGRGAGGQPQHGDAPLASQRAEAALGARLQDLARPEVRREARGHRGPVHVPARARIGAVS